MKLGLQPSSCHFQPDKARVLADAVDHHGGGIRGQPTNAGHSGISNRASGVDLDIARNRDIQRLAVHIDAVWPLYLFGHHNGVAVECRCCRVCRPRWSGRGGRYQRRRFVRAPRGLPHPAACRRPICVNKLCELDLAPVDTSCTDDGNACNGVERCDAVGN